MSDGLVIGVDPYAYVDVPDLAGAVVPVQGPSGGASRADLEAVLAALALETARAQAAESARALSAHLHAIADVTGLQTALDGKATPADVAAAVANLTAGSPAQLDTFLETYNRFLADESALAALTTLVGGKADDTNVVHKNNGGVSQSIAEYLTLGGGVGMGGAIQLLSNTVSTTGSMSSGARVIQNCVATAGAFTRTLSPTPVANWHVFIKTDASANVVTIAAGAGGNINGAASVQLTKQYDVVILMQDGATANVWTIVGGNTDPAVARLDKANTFTAPVSLTGAAGLTVNGAAYLGGQVSLNHENLSASGTVNLYPPVKRCNAAGGALSLALPTAATLGTLIFKKTDTSANPVTITVTSLDGAANVVLEKQNDFVIVRGTNAANVWEIVGQSQRKSDVQVFTVTGGGVYTVPTWATTVEVTAIGGGAGGGSGARGAAGTIRSGGGGGGGGAWSRMDFRASDLPATVPFAVGTGGNGGAAQGTDSTNGVTGSGGGTSSFGATSASYRVTGGGGQPGGGGLIAGGPGGGVGAFGMFSAGTGGAGSGAGTAGSQGSDNAGAGGSGGGGGGGLTAANAFSAGGAGGVPGMQTGQTRAAGGATDGAAGVAPTDRNINAPYGNGGGGGGASSVAAAGGAGGKGGFPGGGGGGGGASTNGSASGAGGNGGAGLLVIVARP